MRLTSAGVLTTTGNVNGASPTEMGYLSSVSSAIQTQLNSKQATLTFGISNTNVTKCGASIVDDDFIRVDGTTFEGRSASEVLSDIGAGTSNMAFSGSTAQGICSYGGCWDWS